MPKTAPRSKSAADLALVTGERARRVARWAIVLAVASTIAFIPGGLTRWVFPKELLVLAACALIALVAPQGRLPRWVLIGLGAAIVLLGVAAILGDAPLAQLFGRFPRYEGLVTLTAYIAALWFGARTLGPSAAESRMLLFRNALSVASVVLALVSLAEAVGLRPMPSDLERPGALLGNATDQGIVGVIYFAMLIVPVVRRWLPARDTAPLPVLALLGAIGALATIAISASRTALLGLGAVVAVLALIEFVRSAQHRRRVLVVTGALLAASASAVILTPLAVSRVTAASPLSSSTVDDRLLNWQATLNMLSGHPILGVGPSGFLDAIPRFLGQQWHTLVGDATILDSPHSWPLQALVAGGPLLLLIALGLAVGVGTVGWRGIRSAATLSSVVRADHLEGAGLAVVGFGIALLTHFTSPGTTVITALLVGSLVAAPVASGTTTVRLELGRVVRVALLALVTIGFAILAWSEVPLQDGVNFAQAGRISEAQSSLSAAVALRPWDSDAAGIAAQVMASAAQAGHRLPGEPDAAPLVIAWAQRSLAVTPHSLSSLTALSIGQQYTGDFAAARATLAQATALAPLDGAIALRLGGVLVLMGDYPAAQTQLLHAAQLGPTKAGPWLALAYLYGKTGHGDLAAAATAKAAALGG